MTVQRWIADTTDTTTIYASERIFDVHAHVHITRGQHGIVKTNSRNSCVSAVKPLVVTQHRTCVVTGRWQAAFMQQYSMQFVWHLNNKVVMSQVLCDDFGTQLLRRNCYRWLSFCAAVTQMYDKRQPSVTVTLLLLQMVVIFCCCDINVRQSLILIKCTQAFVIRFIPMYCRDKKSTGGTNPPKYATSDLAVTTWNSQQNQSCCASKEHTTHISATTPELYCSYAEGCCIHSNKTH